jgi:hypothetical protein
VFLRSAQRLDYDVFSTAFPRFIASTLHRFNDSPAILSPDSHSPAGTLGLLRIPSQGVHPTSSSVASLTTREGFHSVFSRNSFIFSLL